MESLLTVLVEKFEVFLLVLIRCSAMFFVTPIFGRRNVPATFKIGLAFMLSIVLTPTVELQSGLVAGFVQFALLTAKEIAVGLIIGFITYVFFTAIYFAGQIIDMKTGFGIVNVLDPQTNTQVPIMGNFLYIFTLIVFITMDGHLMLIKAMAESFTILPPGHMQVTAETVAEVVSMLRDTFVIGFKISAPVVAAVFLTDVALGILARTMPQMNVFMVGMPLKIMIGMFTLMLMIPVLAIALDVLFTNTAGSIYRVLIHL